MRYMYQQWAQVMFEGRGTMSAFCQKVNVMSN